MMGHRTDDASQSTGAWSTRVGSKRRLGWIGLGMALMMVSNAFADDHSPTGWKTDFEAALTQAKSQNRPVLATVTAVWCGACRQMQQLTLREASVAQLASEQFVTVAIDGDQRADLVSRFGVTAFPTTMVIDAEGHVLHSWIGFQGASGFLSELQAFAKSPPSADNFPAVSALFPMNASPFGFGGFCLVSLLDENILRRGIGEYSAEFRGVRVCFHSAEHRDRFLLNSDRYWPVANGNCLVTSREQRENAPGDPRVGVLWKNRLWFFADRDRQQRFMAAPHRFSNGM